MSPRKRPKETVRDRKKVSEQNKKAKCWESIGMSKVSQPRTCNLISKESQRRLKDHCTH